MRALRRHSGALLLSLSCLTLTSGCMTLMHIIGLEPEKPKVTLRGIEALSLSRESLELKAVLAVENPNGFEIKIVKMDYKLRALGGDAVWGSMHEKIVVPANATTEVSLPLSLKLSVIKDLLGQIVKSRGKAAAELEATLVFDTPLGEYEVQIKEPQSISLPVLGRSSLPRIF